MRARSRRIAEACWLVPLSVGSYALQYTEQHRISSSTLSFLDIYYFYMRFAGELGKDFCSGRAWNCGDVSSWMSWCHDIAICVLSFSFIGLPNDIFLLGAFAVSFCKGASKQTSKQTNKPSQAKPNQTKPNQTKQNKTEQTNKTQHKTKQNKTKQNKKQNKTNKQNKQANIQTTKQANKHYICVSLQALTNNACFLVPNMVLVFSFLQLYY